MKLFNTLIISGLCLASSALWALPGPLVSADWLAENRDSVLVLDVRKDLDSFEKEGHIEDAILVDVNQVRVTRVIDGKELTRMRPTAEQFTLFMQRHGVNQNSSVVLTHRGATPGQVAGAARLYWQMRLFGHENVALLDGGNRAWESALEDLISEVSTISPGNFEAKAENSAWLATEAEVLAALSDNNIQPVDTRDLRYHIGIDKRSYVYAYGHLPGSNLMPYELLHPEKGTAFYYAPEKLKTIMQALGIDPEGPMVFYCNSAFECSSVWFVTHELLGNREARIYDGSLHQWTQNPDNPMTTRLGH